MIFKPKRHFKLERLYYEYILTKDKLSEAGCTTVRILDDLPVTALVLFAMVYDGSSYVVCALDDPECTDTFSIGAKVIADCGMYDFLRPGDTRFEHFREMDDSEWPLINAAYRAVFKVLPAEKDIFDKVCSWVD